MATQHEGTGQHKHKSSEEPFPHNEAPTTSGGGKSSSGKSSTSEHSHSASHEAKSSGSRSGGSSSESSDLKEREYRGPDGEIHHHTTTYQEQHKGKS